MAQFNFENIIPYSPNEIFDVFREQMLQTFPDADSANPIGAKAEKTTTGISGYKFLLNIEITDYRENEIYEITSRASNKQEFISRYELKNLDDNKTRLVFTETNITEGFFGSANAVLTSLVFRNRARKKIEKIIVSLVNELEKRKSEKD